MIRVKPLEWTTTPPPAREREPGMLYAAGIGGVYEVTRAGFLWWAADPFTCAPFGDPDAAKAAAQADHEQRVAALVEVA